MNDAELQLAAALQGVPLEQAMLMQKARRAQGLMDAPGAQGASLGRVYRAASPLEHLATALSRGIGARQMKGVEQEWGGLAQRAQQGGLAAARLERADRDRDFGIKQQGANLAEMKAMADEQNAITEADHRRRVLAETERHNRAAESAALDQFGAIADPVSGGIVIFNKKTGQRMGSLPAGPAPASAPPGLGASHSQPPGLLVGPGSRPGASAAQGAGGLKEAQRTAAARAGEGSIGLEGAIESGFPANKGVGGLIEGAGWRIAESAPALVSEATEQRKAFWENAADPIVRARTGAAMPVEEFRKQMTMLLPRPGEGPDTHVKKAAQMVALFKNQTVGLPPQVQGPLLEQLDALEALIPKTVEEYQRMKSGGETAGAPRRVSTVEEARALTPGTRFIDPNGVERVR